MMNTVWHRALLFYCHLVAREKKILRFPPLHLRCNYLPLALTLSGSLAWHIDLPQSNRMQINCAHTRHTFEVKTRMNKVTFAESWTWTNVRCLRFIYANTHTPTTNRSEWVLKVSFFFVSRRPLSLFFRHRQRIGYTYCVIVVDFVFFFLFNLLHTGCCLRLSRHLQRWRQPQWFMICALCMWIIYHTRIPFKWRKFKLIFRYKKKHWLMEENDEIKSISRATIVLVWTNKEVADVILRI